MAKGLLINPNGIAEVMDFPEKDKLEWYYEMVDCRCIDIVNAYGLEDIAKEYKLESLLGKFCIVVDDEGLLKEKPEINVIASLIYGCDQHGQAIVGNALIAKNEVTEDGIETVGMTDADVLLLQAGINALISRHNERVASNDGD